MLATPLPVRRVVFRTWGLAAALLLVGCASSGDVEQTRQEQEQAKTKMRAELQQERDLAATMEKESEAQRAKAEKLEKGLKGRVGATTTAPPDSITSQASGTTLQITNSTADPVPVQITLGSGYGISNISQLPSSWGVIQDPVGIQGLQGIFILAGNSSVSFNSGASSFSGNVGFGPTAFNRGCGNAAAGACYPNSVNLAEFTLNMAGETVDISDVNGANAAITINFTGQTSNNQWNDGTFNGANPDVTTVNIQPPLSTFANQVGVFGWQATNCINVVFPVPNGPPSNICPAPVNNPGAPQLQTNAQCNIQRGGSAPTGGTVQIVFGGFTDTPSAPQSGCMAIYTISPASGTQNGGTTVTMTGWGLSQATSVTFQGATATIVSQSNTQLVVTTPPCNFCGGGQPWNSNVMLNGSYIVPTNAAGWGASAAYVYTSN
jgi:hypothetical protein